MEPLILLVLLGPLTERAAAGPYDSMARELSSAARSSGVSRVAVTPFEPLDGGNPAEGWNISEKLVTQLVRGRTVQAVERSFLKKLMEENRLGRTGALEPASLRELGRVLSAEAIVTGSYLTVGTELIIHARLIALETGVILAATEKRAKRDMHGLPGFFVPAPEFMVDAPAMPPLDEELRDAVADPDSGCGGAAERVDALESEILDLKARYWALRLKKGLPISTLKMNPGQTITDRELKRRFYARMHEWYGREAVPELSPAESRRFVEVDGRAYDLHRRCGL